METFKNLLLSVGMKRFVEYYEVFNAIKFSDSSEEITKALRKKVVWKESSIATKANFGQSIFGMNRETDVFEYIVCGAEKVDDSVKEKAWKILNDKGIGVIDVILKSL
jgi:hypothetical protein